MRRVIHKIFWVWELEKEEAWINEMASHGYALEHAGRVTFEFEETEANKYKYKELFLKGSAYSAENQKYFRFLEEMGIKTVCWINYPGRCWVYARALSEDYPDGIELYSDIDSEINCLKISLGYFIFCVVFMLFAASLNLSVVIASAFTNSFAVLNLACSIILFALGAAAVTAIVKTIIKINRLKKERAIHE